MRPARTCIGAAIGAAFAAAPAWGQVEGQVGGPAASSPAEADVVRAAPRPGYRRATDLRLGDAIAWTPSGALKAPKGAGARDVVVLVCDDGCTVRHAFELRLRRQGTMRTMRTMMVEARTLEVPRRGTGAIGFRLDAAARRTLRDAGSAELRVRLRVTGPHGTRSDVKALRLAY